MKVHGLLNTLKKDLTRARVSYIKAIFNTPVRAVISYRLNNWLYRKSFTKLSYIFHNIDRRKYAVDIYPESDVGEGLVIAHVGGIVVGAGVKIGNNCTLQSCVTIGQKNERSGVPKIGNNVYIGTGAKILGGVEVGSNCIIGANTVVLSSIPDNCTVVGIPGKIIKIK